MRNTLLLALLLVCVAAGAARADVILPPRASGRLAQVTRVTGPITEAQARRALAAKQSEAAECFARHSTDTPPTGRVVLALDIGADRHGANVRVESNAYAAELGSCLTGVLLRAEFPARGALRVAYERVLPTRAARPVRPGPGGS